MARRFCFVYPWATLGGVERVLLNRLIAFHGAGVPAHVDIMFLHDSGGAGPLQNALESWGIDARVIVANDFEKDASYDMVFCIDCPQAFELCERRKFRFLAECHTSYINNRQYLRNLPAACEAIVSPSALFGDRLKAELGSSNTVDIVELVNFVPWDISPENDIKNLPGWRKKPILFFGRMDLHKDAVALLDAFQIVEKYRPGEFFCVLCGPQSEEVDIVKEINARNLISKVLLLPPLSFQSTSILLELIQKKGGVFVSPSKGESFGLSAAEAICSGLPVVLSDIEEHCSLVRGYEEKFTYRLGQRKSLGEKIVAIFDGYDSSVDDVLKIREKFSSVVFLQHWNDLLKRLNIQ